ncbi:MAG: exonuclease domain-containing protein [Caldilineales bacterium]
MSQDPSPSDYLGNVTFTVLDVETTGLHAGSGHRICEVALLRFRGGKVLDSFETLVDPQRPISPGASAVSGLTDFHLRGQPVFSQVAGQVQAMLDGSVLVAHNAAFDLSFLAGEWRRLRWSPRLGFTVDTLLLARRLYAFRRNNLADVARALRVRVDREHRAMGDVWTTLRVLQTMLADLNRGGKVTLAHLLDAQGGNVLWPEPQTRPLPPLLEDALARGGRLWLRYRDQRGQISERVVEPLDVTDDGQALYLAAYCVQRGEQRTFRLDRVLEMRLDGDPFDDLK